MWITFVDKKNLLLYPVLRKLSVEKIFDKTHGTTDKKNKIITNRGNFIDDV